MPHTRGLALSLISLRLDMTDMGEKGVKHHSSINPHTWVPLDSIRSHMHTWLMFICMAHVYLQMCAYIYTFTYPHLTHVCARTCAREGYTSESEGGILIFFLIFDKVIGHWVANFQSVPLLTCVKWSIRLTKDYFKAMLRLSLSFLKVYPCCNNTRFNLFQQNDNTNIVVKHREG